MKTIKTTSLEIFKNNIYLPYDIGMVSNNAYLSVVATNKCNRSCAYCINGNTDRTLHLPVRKMVSNVSRLVDKYGIKEAIILGGEPTLHPHICDIIHGLKYAGIKVVRLTTNGIALSKEMLNDMVHFGLDGLNVSYHNGEDFITNGRLHQIYMECRRLGIKLRVNTNIWRGNHDTLESFLSFYNEQLVHCCDEVRVSNIIPKDDFSVNSQNNDDARTMILPDEQYNSFFQSLCEHFQRNERLSLFENQETLGFVRYILIPTFTPIIVNWNIGSKVAKQVCENDVENRQINTFKCLVSGHISLSWNENNVIIK